MAIAFCPDCEEPVRVATPKLGQRVTCESCGGELEIVEVSPLELDWAYDELADDWEEEEETDDWDDEEEDDWDDTDPAATRSHLHCAQAQVCVPDTDPAGTPSHLHCAQAQVCVPDTGRQDRCGCRDTGEEDTSEDTDDQ